MTPQEVNRLLETIATEIEAGMSGMNTAYADAQKASADIVRGYMHKEQPKENQ